LSTSDYSEAIHENLLAIRSSLPVQQLSSMPMITELLNSQEATTTALAEHLESLAVHYDKISEALKDSEAGEPFGEEDLQGQ
jgi:autophagy-related protein 17